MSKLHNRKAVISPCGKYVYLVDNGQEICLLPSSGEWHVQVNGQIVGAGETVWNALADAEGNRIS